ncbi:MAG: 3-dehydroquinate synthase [Bacteroidota bacterium]
MKTPSFIAQSFSVSYDYKLHFTEDMFSTRNGLLYEVMTKYSEQDNIKAIFAIDGGVYLKHPKLLDKVEAYCNQYDRVQLEDILVLPGGEECKNDHGNVQKVLRAINDNAICRHSFVVAIGGGAVIDMVGYAAATAHRGVKLIRVPTTVLAQNDAAVGVKNGINEFGKKNFIGTFAVPLAIINDYHFLETLDQRDWISGIAEAMKVALIKDKIFFDFIGQNAVALAKRKPEPMKHLIYRCAEIHMGHIANGGDPFEDGSSRPLDFGHWAAHKLEQMTDYRLRHGEAVAMGIALDVTYAKLTGLIDQSILDKVLDVFNDLGFDLRLPIENDLERKELLNGIGEFREHLGGKLTITLLSRIGSKQDVHEIDMKKMEEAITVRSIAKEELSC